MHAVCQLSTSSSKTVGFEPSPSSTMAGKGDDEAPLTAALRLRVRPLIDLADSLRKLGLQQDLPIPQIAVCGNQSSGKSSVLEAISRVTFPRG